MTSRAKKQKCKNTLYDRGGEKGKLHRLKGCAMYHKKDRIEMRKACRAESLGSEDI